MCPDSSDESTYPVCKSCGEVVVAGCTSSLKAVSLVDVDEESSLSGSGSSSSPSDWNESSTDGAKRSPLVLPPSSLSDLSRREALRVDSDSQDLELVG